jgi:hypothetical protein
MQVMATTYEVGTGTKVSRPRLGISRSDDLTACVSRSICSAPISEIGLHRARLIANRETKDLEGEKGTR